MLPCNNHKNCFECGYFEGFHFILLWGDIHIFNDHCNLTLYTFIIQCVLCFQCLTNNFHPTIYYIRGTSKVSYHYCQHTFMAFLWFFCLKRFHIYPIQNKDSFYTTLIFQMILFLLWNIYFLKSTKIAQNLATTTL